MSEKSKRRKAADVLSVIIFVLILLTVAFIFFNSSLPRDNSQEESNFVGELLRPILNPDNRFSEREYSTLTRKLAHFTEYFWLGAELTALWFCQRRFSLWARLFIALATAVCDESIQILSGRGPKVSDILIDFSGALTGMLVLYLLGTLIVFLDEKRRNKHSGLTAVYKK